MDSRVNSDPVRVGAVKTAFIQHKRVSFLDLAKPVPRTLSLEEVGIL